MQMLHRTKSRSDLPRRAAFWFPHADHRNMDLADLVESLKRALAAPGEFTSTFPNSTDDDLKGTLADALSEAQLDTFLPLVILDPTTNTTDVDLTSAERALVVLYAMARVLVARISNLRNRSRYKAGNVEAEFEQSATVLTELLKEIAARKKQLILDAATNGASHAFAMVDSYVARQIGDNASALDYPAYYSNLAPDFSGRFAGRW